ncbi:MAG: hypothetical protein JXR91_02015 [Deltaproteobacteria bacterium]|nr:hypothetical protein [Deltaproteobacteria bacterium]
MKSVKFLNSVVLFFTMQLFTACIALPGGFVKVDKNITKCGDNPVSPLFTGDKIQNSDAKVNVPFGSKPHKYTEGIITPTGVTNEQMDKAVTSFYDHWKTTLIKKGCGEDRYYLSKGKGSDGITVSEAHGYGMIISALMAGYDKDAKKHFDGMYYYFREHPSNYSKDLMAWHQNRCCRDDEGADAATDGDIDIAYALLLADKQWGSCGAINYKKEALKVIKAIKEKELNSSGKYTLLGDWATPDDNNNYYFATRASDFITSEFRSFGEASGNITWRILVESIYTIIGKIQADISPESGLLPDFILNPLSTPKPAPARFLEDVNDGNYYYNSCRVPWRLGTDYLLHGDKRMKGYLQKINSWAIKSTGGNPENIKAGYTMDGKPVAGSNYATMAFIAPFGVSAMADPSNQKWLDSLWNTISNFPPEDYYEDSIKLMTMIVMSQNWWAPEKIKEVCNN